MKILNVETVASTTGALSGRVRDDVGQFALIGRSNVGKSTLINALVGRRIARTSAAAGKTRLLHVYQVTAEGGPGGLGQWTTYLIDLPGYGYARGGPEAGRELAGIIDAYVFGAAPAGRRGLLLLVDSRHPGLKSDLQAHRLLSERVQPPLVVATKIDKLTRTERTRNLRALEQAFGAPPLPVSASTGEGLDALWGALASRDAGTT